MDEVVVKRETRGREEMVGWRCGAVVVIVVSWWWGALAVVGLTSTTYSDATYERSYFPCLVRSTPEISFIGYFIARYAMQLAYSAAVIITYMYLHVPPCTPYSVPLAPIYMTAPEST